MVDVGHCHDTVQLNSGWLNLQTTSSQDTEVFTGMSEMDSGREAEGTCLWSLRSGTFKGAESLPINTDIVAENSCLYKWEEGVCQKTLGNFEKGSNSDWRQRSGLTEQDLLRRFYRLPQSN